MTRFKSTTENARRTAEFSVFYSAALHSTTYLHNSALQNKVFPSLPIPPLFYIFCRQLSGGRIILFIRRFPAFRKLHQATLLNKSWNYF